MNPDDSSPLLDRDDQDGDEFATGTVADAEPVAQATDVDLDEDLIDAELGELDAPIIDDELDALDEELLDAEEDEDEDDQEITLLQELGIDLDAPDADGLGFDLTIGLDDDANEDEVAA